MHRYLFFLFISYASVAQSVPKEGSMLNYRIIGFSVPSVASASAYKLEVAKGNFTSEDDFKRNVTVAQTGDKSRIIAEVSSFSSNYTWRITSLAGEVVKATSPLYHFGIGTIPDIDTARARLRIITEATKYKDGYIFIESNKALYDMKGEPIWYLPNTDEVPIDLKLSTSGTITFIDANKLYEVDYNGHILWHHDAPTTAEGFHHEFTRMNNGHYMALGNTREYWKLPAAKNQVAHSAADSERYYQSMLFGNIGEYNEHGDKVWSWNSSKYIKNSDIIDSKTADGKFDIDLHENSFYFDEKNKNIYVNFRVISRIVKIKYPEGKVLNSYGPVYVPGKSIRMAGELFCNEHSVRRSKKGFLYLFNNNICQAPFVPKIILVEEPKNGQGELKKIWEYECTIENPERFNGRAMRFNKGGNVTELPDESLFVSMGEPYSKMFIVNKNKEILWSAVAEKLNLSTNTWEDQGLYRASIIVSGKDLEKLIWNAGN